MNKMPKKKSHTVRRLLSYVGRGYLIRFFWCWYASWSARWPLWPAPSSWAP